MFPPFLAISNPALEEKVPPEAIAMDFPLLLQHWGVLSHASKSR
jgi:hypothetical protein